MLSRWRSTTRDAGWQTVSSGRVPGKRGLWRMAIAGFPAGSGMATGKTLASLLSTPSNSMPSIRAEGREPQTLPVEEVLREGQGNPRAFGRKRRVSHHVTLEVFAKSDPRILAASAAIRPQLIIRFGLQCDAEPLDARRVAGLIELHSRDADARVISLRDQTREEVITDHQGREPRPGSRPLRPPSDCPARAPSSSPSRFI